MLITFLIVLSSCLLVMSCILIYKLYQYSLIIINTETAIEESLDVLNERYESIASVLEKDVFFDSIEVRQVINEIKLSQDAIYAVAQKMIKDKQINEKKDEA
jgi:hypothetical protein